MKVLFFDLETTGVMYWKNGIHQISGILEVDGVVQEEFDLKVRPHPNAIIEEEALKIGGVTLQQVQAYPPMNQIYDTLIETLSKYCNRYDKSDKIFLAGYNNAHFDNQFFRAFFKQNRDKYFGSWFWSNTIDVMVLATQYLLNQRTTMENFKLMTVAKQMGLEIDEDKLHDATYDIYLTREIYKLVTLKNTPKGDK